MSIDSQKILPAVRKIKDLERLLQTSYEYIVLLDSHIGQLHSLIELARRHGKQMLLHVDLIEGLKSDEYAADFLCQQLRPAGLISTRANVVKQAKKNKRIAIQRLFLLDTGSLNKSYALMERTNPDYIEVLPGIVPSLVREVRDTTGVPVFAGGFVRTVQEVEDALQAGATAVTTSNRELWEHYEK